MDIFELKLIAQIKALKARLDANEKRIIILAAKLALQHVYTHERREELAEHERKLEQHRKYLDWSHEQHFGTRRIRE